MKLPFRTPELIPTLATFIVVIVTMWLGVWQLQRLEWKNRLLAQIEEAQSQPPHDIHSFSDAELEQAQWQNIVAGGVLLHQKEIHMTPRYLNGILGYGVITPLAVATAQGTEYVLVNRGWVPPEQKDAAKRISGNPLGTVIVQGAIRSALTPGSGFTQDRFRPDNQPDKNLWYWYDLPAISKATGLKLLPVLIDATSIRTRDGGTLAQGPKPFPIEVNIRNDHLGYAITWFLIGLSAIIVYLAYYWERKKS